MIKFYKFFTIFILSIIFFLLVIIGLFFFKPNLTSKYLIQPFVKYEDKILVRKFFIERNFKKHLNLMPNTQFIKLSFDKINLGEEFNYDLNNQKKNIPYHNSGHLALWQDLLLVMNAKGTLYYFELNKLKEKKSKKIIIETNINIKGGYGYSVKDILVYNEDLYVSYVEEFKKNCLRIVIKKGKINKTKIFLKDFFQPNECIKSDNTLYKNNHPGQAGGRLAVFKNNLILLSTGNLRDLSTSQNPKSIYGKIIQISIENLKYEIFSYGHRNPQGLFVDGNIILSTEHGPYGGDEVNLIEKGKNYGFPVSSYGEKYTYNYKKNNYDYLKTHRGFQEPIFSFIPSIGISQIVKIPNEFHKKWTDNYFLSSLSGHTLYRLRFSDNFKKLQYIEPIYIGERIRDIIYDQKYKKFYLMLEETGSLAIIGGLN